MPLKLVFLKSFNSITEAGLVKNLLQAEGIKAVIKNSGLQFGGDLGDSFGADLFVFAGEFEKARQVLNETNPQ